MRKRSRSSNKTYLEKKKRRTKSTLISQALAPSAGRPEPDKVSFDCVMRTTKQLFLQVVSKAALEGKLPSLSDLFTDVKWFKVLENEFEKEYFKNLESFLHSEWSDPNVVVYPTPKDIFKAFELTVYDRVRVVVIGQDPYHGPNQATGLSFSVPKTKEIPSSLKNIFKEIQADIGYNPGNHGDLERWAEQGVLLLNSVLTVRRNEANSHRSRGWELFTDSVIEALNDHENSLVFILWGNQAQKKGKCIDENKHCVLRAPHPSGLSAHKGFFGSKPFSQCNSFLVSNGVAEIDWHVT